MSRLREVELVRLRLPLVSPFRTSFATETERDMLLVRLETDDGVGWGECVADAAPLYSSEYVDGAIDVMRRVLVPMVFSRKEIRAQSVAEVLEPVAGHRMAKAALEMGMLDHDLRLRDQSYADWLGVTRSHVPAGVSVGIHDTIPELLRSVEGYLDEGYARIKLKIEPGWDLEPVAAVRGAFGDIPLQVDANAAYRLQDASLLARFDDYDLLMIEQPLPEEHVRHHALLAEQVRTPICLDESVLSAVGAADCIALGACRIINVKPGRVGGYLEAQRVHDVARAQGVGVWCGGMVESGLGRRANIALAALPGFTYVGDLSGSARFFDEDVTEPVVMRDGQVEVPRGPGFGAHPLPDRLARLTTWSERLTA